MSVSGTERPSSGGDTLYRSADLRVTFTDVPASSGDVCIVSFDPLTDRESLDRNGFAERFLFSAGYPALHIVPRRNRWYEETDLSRALEAARDAASRYRLVLSFGSSMGGYAAIRYGALAGATKALAFSPQYAVGPEEAPFETRWKRYTRDLSFVGLREEQVPKIERSYVFYDPRTIDRLHAEKISQRYPTTHVRMPYAGHPVIGILLETGCLKLALEQVVQGSFHARDFERLLRQVRSQSGKYLISLARQLPQRHLQLKLRLAGQAVERSPMSATCASFMGIALDEAARFEEANRWFSRSATLRSDDPVTLELQARHLVRSGRVQVAAAIAARAYQLAPRQSRVARTHALTRLALGRAPGALLLLLRATDRSFRPLVASLLDVLRVWAWRARRFGSRGRDPGRGIPLRWGAALTTTQARPPPECS